MAAKTLTAPVINGIVTTTGLTLPSFTAGAQITVPDGFIMRCAGAPVITFNDTSDILAITAATFTLTNTATGSDFLQIYSTLSRPVFTIYESGENKGSIRIYDVAQNMDIQLFPDSDCYFLNSGNFGIATSAFGTGAVRNLALSNANAVLGAALANVVQMACIDFAAADARLYIQSEAGNPIIIGNNAIRIGTAQVVGAQAAAIANVPAGGTGTAAGGWDTAVNRDDAIAKINDLLAKLRTHGLIAT